MRVAHNHDEYDAHHFRVNKSKRERVALSTNTAHPSLAILGEFPGVISFAPNFYPGSIGLAPGLPCGTGGRTSVRLLGGMFGDIRELKHARF